VWSRVRALGLWKTVLGVKDIFGKPGEGRSQVAKGHGEPTEEEKPLCVGENVTTISVSGTTPRGEKDIL